MDKDQMTNEENYHFDVAGFLHIPGVLNSGEVSRVNPEKGLDKKGWQVKDPEIKAADVVVLDRDYASDDVLRRIQSIGTPYVVVGADGLTWSACLRPTIAILRGDSNRRVTESTSTVEEEAGGALKE